jgi:hypothetical protein
MPTPPQRRQTRGAVQKPGATFVAAWIPDEIVAAMDQAVKHQDTDRSKLIRKALRLLLSKP